MRRYVYNRHQESGKDVISHQVHRSRVPKRTVTMQTHDPQEDERYMLSTTLMTFHDVLDHNEVSNKTGNPGITTPGGAVKHMEGQIIPLIAGA